MKLGIFPMSEPSVRDAHVDVMHVWDNFFEILCWLVVEIVFYVWWFRVRLSALQKLSIPVVLDPEERKACVVKIVAFLTPEAGSSII